MFGVWDDCRVICVSFQRRGQRRQGKGTGLGKPKDVKKWQKTRSRLGIRDKEKAEQKTIVKKQGDTIEGENAMLSNQGAMKMTK